MPNKTPIEFLIVSVNRLVAQNANSQTVRHFQAQFWKIFEVFNMVRVQIAALFAAHLAGEIITLKNSLTPLIILFSLSRFPIIGRHSTFPICIKFSLSFGRHLSPGFNRMLFTKHMTRTFVAFHSYVRGISAEKVQTIPISQIYPKFAFRVPGFTSGAPFFTACNSLSILIYGNTIRLAERRDISLAISIIIPNKGTFFYAENINRMD